MAQTEEGAARTDWVGVLGVGRAEARRTPRTL